MRSPLLIFNDKGIYCKQADVYLDPWKPVKKAIITHDHAIRSLKIEFPIWMPSMC